MTAILTLAFEEEPQSYPRAIKDRTSENNVAVQLLTSKYLQEHMMPMLIFPSALRGTWRSHLTQGWVLSSKGWEVNVPIHARGQRSAASPNLSQSPPLTTFDYLEFLEIEVFKTWCFGVEKQNILIWEFHFNFSWTVRSQQFVSFYLICASYLGCVSHRKLQPVFQTTQI